MKPSYHLLVHSFLCCFLLAASLPSPAMMLAMSQVPEDVSMEPVEVFSIEDAKAGKYGRQFEGRDPEEDARAALNKGDKRLLGFATRTTSVPGVKKETKDTAIKTCGVHLIKGFGDVLRSKEELAAMRLASSYAKRYNAVVLEECLKKE